MAKYVSEDGVKAIRDWVKVHDNKSLYNLGYYDTMTENADGSYTITRQTGYVILDGVENKFVSKAGTTSNSLYYTTNNYIMSVISKPDKVSIIADVICNLFETKNFVDLYNNNTYGIGVYANGDICVGLTTAIDTLDKANAYLVQNPISIQFKLANATTEKVEKNHYATYNQRFILEHNKSEAERSANLFNNPYNYSGTNNGVSINLVGNECILNGTSTNGYYNNLGSVTLKAGTYTFNQVILSGSINGDINRIKFGLYKDGSLFPLGYATGTYTLTEDTSVGIVVWFGEAGITFNNCKLAYMLNEGSTPLPYQPYEGKVIHEKDIKNLSGVIGYGITQLYKHDIEFDISNGDGIKCTFWSTSNVKITNFSQIPYLAFSNIQVKNISNEKILNVVQWNSDGFRFYESDDTSTLTGDAYDGVTAYYINGEPQL